MKAVRGLAFAVAAVLVAGTGAAQDKKDDAKDYAKKIVGKWEITKAGGGAQAGTTIEFLKDGKLKANLKVAGMEVKVSGKYKVEKEKVTTTIEFMGQEEDEVLTITKLTDEALEWKDGKGGVDVLKKLKDKEKEKSKE